ncbi:glycosyltransferase family 4 protein [Acidithiobacillus sp. 'AMD consortium']|uniref:Glycosyltransferase family 4 protein n=1 Tax=Acidithiobacillus ferruginosus TaxID=3063951 RepID=A0ACD5IHI2_9PROT|nr:MULTISPECIES: glycosyltransferase family 4 protein [Acidithiobacillus]MBU2814206.1 glycosyltransferase family 4 protein [Acidithiobacillus ferruginosus]QFG77309.1 glycosyltransferase family 4 protein [Acidithiobacillus sp. 'AMD consortium']
MKILHLNTFDDPVDGGGAEVVLWELIRGLASAGHANVLLATCDQPGLQRTERDGIPIWRAGLRNLYWPGNRIPKGAALRAMWHAFDSYNLWMQDHLLRVLRTERPDVVTVHGLSGWSAASWKTIQSQGIPIVQVLHDHYLLCPRATMFKKGRTCEKQCTSCHLLRIRHPNLSNALSAVVGVSRYILDRHMALGYFQDVALRQVIHNVRSPGALGLDEPSPVRESPTGLRIGFIGQLVPAKGVDILIGAFKAAVLPDAELWIAGSGKPDYEASLRKNAASTPVRFLGRVPPRDFYPQVDIVVVPSLWQEPLGLVVAEALAFGKPVIASKRGGIPEMIKDGETGLLFDPNRPEDLQESLHHLGSDRAMRVRMGKMAKISSTNFLDVTRWVDGYIGIYRQLDKRGI